MSLDHQKGAAVKQRFDLLSTEYDASRRLIIPCFDAFYESGIALLCHADESPQVLDIGAGTGIFTEKLLSRYPDARVTLIDFSENMLDIARMKFAQNHRITYLIDNYASHDFGTERYDIILSALSIHHLNAAEKQAFYQKVFTLLHEGGVLLNADLIRSDTAGIDRAYQEQWESFVRANVGENHFDQFLESKSHDDPSTIRQQVDWLREAGFTEADCVYQRYNLAVFYAKR